MIDDHGNEVVYNYEQLINITKAQIIPQLHPQNPDELKRRCHRLRVEGKTKIKSSSSIIMGSLRLEATRLDAEEPFEISVQKQIL